MVKRLGAAVLGLALILWAAMPAQSADSDAHLRAAVQALQVAQRELAQAERDKGGHRARAESLVRQAIAQVEAGIHYDYAHDRK